MSIPAEFAYSGALYAQRDQQDFLEGPYTSATTKGLRAKLFHTSVADVKRMEIVNTVGTVVASGDFTRTNTEEENLPRYRGKLTKTGNARFRDHVAAIFLNHDKVNTESSYLRVVKARDQFVPTVPKGF